MSDGQIFVLCIIAMVMATGIIKNAMGDRSTGGGCSKRSRRQRRRAGGEATATPEDSLATLNARLDSVIDRLAVLETIVTDEDRQLRRKFDELDRNNHRPTA